MRDPSLYHRVNRRVAQSVSTRERWAKLAIIHRLDKETSGVMVFSKTPLANRSLTEQFTAHSVRKKYLLLTDRAVRPGEIVAKSALVRAGDRYVSRPVHAGGETERHASGSLEKRESAGEVQSPKSKAQSLTAVLGWARSVRMQRLKLSR